jgi:hypothetical protein
MHNRPENLSRDQYFEKLPTSLINWVEKLNGRVIGRFVLINQNAVKTILRSIDRENFYIELDSETAKWGRSPNVIHNVFEYGSWVPLADLSTGGKALQFHGRCQFSHLNTDLFLFFYFFNLISNQIILIKPLYISCLNVIDVYFELFMTIL